MFGIVLGLFVLGTGLLGHSEDASNCKPVVASIQFACPAGWAVVDQGHPRPGMVTFGNYRPNPDKNMAAIIPGGKSTIEIMPMPNLYQSFEEWISATEHMAPSSKETTETFVNDTGGPIQARCFTSAPAPKKPEDRACMFQIDGVPIILDLFISPKATNVPELEAHVREMIKTARPER